MKHKPPGQVKKGSDADVIMMICTAGHVDHGKTSLVKQLTGCETDRLKVERERGLTIELGFAPCMLRGNLSVGIVDVPGHEKFIKNMVSGIPGIDLAILVIAADDGIMPQTIEHFQIMELLGVRSGIVALTKIDLVSEERVTRLSGEIKDFLKGSFMEEAPVCPVSSETFDGFFDFYDVLVERIQDLSKKRANGVFRMPVERTFIQKGFGTILSGIPLDGRIEVGTQVEIVPGHYRGKIRGIQVFGREADAGGYGQCLALNIPDFGKVNPSRGQIVCIPGYAQASQYFHVRVKMVPGVEKPLKNAEEIKFHTGTSEITGKIFLLEEKTLNAGQTGLATVALANPVAASTLDPFIIRRISPAITVAGGEILTVSQTAKRPRKKRVAERLKVYQAFFEGFDASSSEGADRRIEYYLCADSKTGASMKEISIGTLLPMDVVRDCLTRLLKGNKVLPVGSGSAQIGQELQVQGDYFLHEEAYKSCLGEVEEWIRESASAADVLSLTISDLRKRFDWPAALWNRVLEDLNKGDLVRVRGNKLVLKGAESKFDEEETRLLEEIMRVYDESGYKSPRPADLSEMLGAPQEKINRLLEHLYNEAQLIQLTKNVVMTFKHVKWAQDELVRLIKEKGSFNSADFKHVINSTRKYALAVMDYLDLRRITMCLPNHDRKLTPDYEKNLL